MYNVTNEQLKYIYLKLTMHEKPSNPIAGDKFFSQSKNNRSTETIRRYSCYDNDSSALLAISDLLATSKTR